MDSSHSAPTFAVGASSGDYRPDIDGLRAIAVSAVVAHHFSSDVLPGGYLGVDMFFVISGYVITSSLAKQSHVSLGSLLTGFYARRIKWLLPALIACVLLTSVVGSLFIEPSTVEYTTSLRAGAAALAGLSNLYFYDIATDYFGPMAQFNLFTHTWSLGVEEQFYLVFPALNGVLYAGTPVALAARGVDSLMDDKRADGTLLWSAKRCVLASNQDVGKTIDLDACTVRARNGADRRLLVIGNSYSVAEFEMYTVLAERNIGSVTITSSWGASPVPGMVNQTPWSKANAYYWETVVPSLLSRLKEGDLVVMANDVALLSPASPSIETDRMLEQFEAGLSRFTAELEKRGIGVVFQAGNPFTREARCGPDSARRQWFHLAGYTPCTFYSKEYSLQRRSRLQAVLEEVRSTHGNFHILDLFPVMCPGAECRLTDDAGVILYRDGWSHPSIEANYRNRDAFVATIESAIDGRKSTAAAGGSEIGWPQDR